MKPVGVALAVLATATAVYAAPPRHLADQLKVRISLEENNKAALWPIPPEWSALGADWGFITTLNVTVSNMGPEHNGKTWEMYFSTPRRVLKLVDNRFNVEQMTGDLYKITPTENFEGFPAKGTVSFQLKTEYWKVFATDFMPRWYVVDGAMGAKVIPNTNTEDWVSYADPIPPEKAKNRGNDLNVYQTPTVRYVTNSHLETTEDISAKVIPTPLQTEILPGHADVSNGISITASGLSAESVAVINDRLGQLGFAPKIGAYPVTISIDNTIPAPANKPEGYTLEVTPSGAVVKGYDAAGAFYGAQTVAALTTVNSQSIPLVKIADTPRFGYRGQHADIARNFHGKETILKLLDQMAAYKLNKFLFHVSDDEGWRVEIDGLPELTSVGARRCHDVTERECLLPQLGSGPNNEHKALYLTKQDYMEIVSYASARHIEVIPEVDMPAHARAAVMAMEARYYTSGDETYRLIDPDDATRLATIQYYDFKSLINPCRPSVQSFVDKIMTEFGKMHAAAGAPLKSWSYGADEAKNAIKGVVPDWKDQCGGVDGGSAPSGDYPIWAIKNVASDPKNPTAPTFAKDIHSPYGNSPMCASKYGYSLPAAEPIKAPVCKANNVVHPSVKIMSDFARMVRDLAKKHNYSLQAWSDGFADLDRPADLAGSTGMVWDALFWGTKIETLAQNGISAVSANPDFTYFDMPYEVNTAERGYYWASRSTGLKRTFSFAPVNVYQNAETATSRDNTPYFLQSGTADLSHVVKGLQGHIWSETVRTQSQFEYMLFPRMLALAERAWHVASHELEFVPGRIFSGGADDAHPKTEFVNTTGLDAEYQSFVNVLAKKELHKLDAAGIQYRVPPAGAAGKDGVLYAASELPGLQVQYSTNGKRWNAVPSTGAPITSSQVHVRTVSADGKRFSRVETLTFDCKSRVSHIPDTWCVSNKCNPGVCYYLDAKNPTPARTCVAKKGSGVADEWCAQVQCVETYSAQCEWMEK